MIFCVIKNKEVIDIFNTISAQQLIDLKFRGFVIIEFYTKNDYDDMLIQFQSELLVKNPGFNTIIRGLMDLK